jgi:hypothetical protein
MKRIKQGGKAGIYRLALLIPSSFPYAGIDQFRLYKYDLRLFAEPPQQKR